jgi:YVTN family beta-propeller protein
MGLMLITIMKCSQLACLVGAVTLLTPAFLAAHADDSSNVALSDTSSPKNVVVATLAVGSGPVALVAGPYSKFVFVANFESNNISVIDTATNTVEANPIATGVNPSALAITLHGKYLYVANGENVSVIKASNGVLGNVLLNAFGEAVAAAISPDGLQAYFPDAISKQIAVIDTRKKKLVTPITTRGIPTSAIFSPDGAYAYAAIPGAGAHKGSVAIIDTSSRSVVSYIDVKEPWYLTLSPDGQTLYATAQASPGVTSVIDTSTNSVIRTFSVKSTQGQPALTPDGKYLYVPLVSKNSVAVINTAKYKIVSEIAVGSGPNDVAILPNGKYAYVCNSSDNTVTVIDISGN